MSVYDDVVNNWDAMRSKPTTRGFIEVCFNHMTMFIDDLMRERGIYVPHAHRSFESVYSDCKDMTNGEVITYCNQWRMNIELYISK